MRIRFNEQIKAGNEICIIKNMFYNNNLFDSLFNEIDKSLYIPWHGDTHLIANDKSEIDWKQHCPTFNTIINQISEYFNMTVAASRLNYYTNSQDWKPYHHDAAALKPDKAKTQNITVGISFGLTREISFESAERNRSTRKTINFVLENGTVYAFGNQINVDFRHGIPQIIEKIDEKRISIILWGYSTSI